jgi:hypothetical protein
MYDDHRGQKDAIGSASRLAREHRTVGGQDCIGERKAAG